MKKGISAVLCVLMVMISLTGCSLIRKAAAKLLPDKTKATLEHASAKEPDSTPTPVETAQEPTEAPPEKRVTGEYVSAGDGFVLALRKDGTAIAAGQNSSGQCDVADWKGIIAVTAGRWHSVGLYGDGTVVAVGDNNFNQCDVSGWENILSVSAGSMHTAGLTSSGRVVAAGENKNGQCNVEDWSNIVAVSCGSRHTVGLQSDGTVVASGENDFGQCDVSGWYGIVAIFTGDVDTFGLRADGTVLTTSPFGNEAASWKGIVTLSSGSYHSVGIRADGSAVSSGLDKCGEREVSGWRDIVAVSAGYQYTIGVKGDGTAVAVGENDFGQCDVQDWHNIGFPAMLPLLPEMPEMSAEPDESLENTAAATFAPSGHVLTIKTVKLKEISVLGEVTAVDDNGEMITLPDDYNLWFVDGKFESAILAKGGSFMITEDGSLLLAEDCALDVIMTIQGTRYRFQVGTGIQFNYTVVDGAVKLMVDERFVPEP